MGAEARDIPEDKALDVVFGYTVANDVWPATSKPTTASGCAARD
ncbi:hypothetical protein ACFV2X_43985 [Streptomyces sp. NPDC059679]